MKIEIEVTDLQAKFLKEFAAKHYSGAKDNLCTSMPIHVVQTRDDVYFEADSEYCDESIFVGSDGDEYKTAEEVVTDYYDDEEPPIPIVPYDSYMTLIDTSGAEHFITSPDDYFKVYKMGWDINYCSRVKRYRDVAFFFILDEAKQYMKYQAHNLNNPRTYTYSPGYSNYGDYEHFYLLLRGLGQKLNEMDK